MIILEGADSSGKSTLADILHNKYGWPIQRSEGPPKSRDEINSRIDRYFQLPYNTIYDRHPVISDQIYGQVFQRPPWVESRHIVTLESLQPIIVYCRAPTTALAPQTNEAVDTPEHVERLARLHPLVIDAYELFFIGYPNVVRYTWDKQKEALSWINSLISRRSTIGFNSPTTGPHAS